MKPLKNALRGARTHAGEIAITIVGIFRDDAAPFVALALAMACAALWAAILTNAGGPDVGSARPLLHHDAGNHPAPGRAPRG